MGTSIRTWCSATTRLSSQGWLSPSSRASYLAGRFGIRIEDIAIIGDDGRAEPLNRADHGLAIVR